MTPTKLYIPLITCIFALTCNNVLRIVLITCAVHKGKDIISYNLTPRLCNYFDHHSQTLEINLNTGAVKLSRYAYLNRVKVYEDPRDAKCFFLIFTYKRVNKKAALKILTDYRDNRAVNKQLAA